MADDNAEDRGHRALALMCASISWKGKGAPDYTQIESLAEEFYEYIVGGGDIGPLADAVIGGRMPKP